MEAEGEPEEVWDREGEAELLGLPLSEGEPEALGVSATEGEELALPLALRLPEWVPELEPEPLAEQEVEADLLGLPDSEPL